MVTLMNAFFELSRENDNLLFCVNSSNNGCHPHFHANIEIVLILKGEMEITINQEKQVLTEGCVSVANSYDIHSYHTPERSESILLIIPANTAQSFHSISRTMTFQKSFMGLCSRSGDIRDAMTHLLEFNGTSDSMISKGYIYVVLGILTEQLGLISREAGSGSAQAMRNILIYLERNYLNPITIGDLAKQFGYHKDYLSRLINSNLGCGFNHYLNVLRARHAARLIRETSDSLIEISFKSGFCSSRTFNRAFQSFYQVTPLEYKRQQWSETDADRETSKELRNLNHTAV